MSLTHYKIRRKPAIFDGCIFSSRHGHVLFLRIIGALLLLSGVILGNVQPGLAQAGDGSFATNRDLFLRGGGTVCLNPCVPVSLNQGIQPRPSAAGYVVQAPGGAGVETSVPSPAAGPAGLPEGTDAGTSRQKGQSFFPVPREPYHPFFDVDWQVGLSATHTGGTSSGKNRVTLTPQTTLTHTGLRSQFSLGARARLSVTDDQLTRIEQGTLTYDGQYSLDPTTQLTSSLSLAVSQQDVNAPGVSDTIVQMPVMSDLRGRLGLVSNMGRFGVDADLSIERVYNSDSILVGNIAQSNGDLNFTRLGATFRSSFSFTPEIGLFVQGEVTHDWYDAAPVSTKVLQNNISTSLTAGVSVNWRDVLAAEASVGYSLRRFDADSIPNMASTVFGLKLTYMPNTAFSANGQFTTTLTPQDPSAGQAASVDYGALLNVGYRMAPWVGLRASASAGWVVPVTGTALRTTYAVGAGADFAVNRHVAINLDYLYTWAQRLPSPAEYEHAATIGITVSR